MKCSRYFFYTFFSFPNECISLMCCIEYMYVTARSDSWWILIGYCIFYIFFFYFFLNYEDFNYQNYIRKSMLTFKSIRHLCFRVIFYFGNSVSYITMQKMINKLNGSAAKHGSGSNIYIEGIMFGFGCFTRQMHSSCM